jgi:hypothetical protein
MLAAVEPTVCGGYISNNAHSLVVDLSIIIANRFQGSFALSRLILVVLTCFCLIKNLLLSSRGPHGPHGPQIKLGPLEIWWDPFPTLPDYQSMMKLVKLIHRIR